MMKLLIVIAIVVSLIGQNARTSGMAIPAKSGTKPSDNPVCGQRRAFLVGASTTIALLKPEGASSIAVPDDSGSGGISCQDKCIAAFTACLAECAALSVFCPPVCGAAQLACIAAC